MKLKRFVVITLITLLGLSIGGFNQKTYAAEVTDDKEEVVFLSSVDANEFGTGIHLPAKVKDNSKVKKIVIPKDVEYVLSDSRYETDKSLVQYYESLTPNCPNLAEVEVDPENPNFTVVDGILYSKDLKELYYCPPAKKGAVILPKEVEIIQYMAFQECSNITSITFSSSLKFIYEGAFGGNVKLNKLSINNNPNFIVESNALLSSNKEVIYLYAQGQKRTTYVIPEGVRRVNSSAFMGSTYLQEVTVPKTVSSIGLEAFENCSSLTKVNLQEGLLEVEAGAFLNCSRLKELVFPNGLLYVYQDAIKGCNNLLTITIPESIQEIQLNLNDVKNRVIYCYSRYCFSWDIEDKKVIKSMTVYVYKGSGVAYGVKELGVLMKYITPEDNSISPMTKAPKQAVKGTGKPDTSWYDAKKTTFSLKNPDQLAGLAKLVNQKISMYGKTFVLEHDLDLSKYPNWEPIGICTSSKYRLFKGTFDGSDHTIYNLRINKPNSSTQGLFGFVKGDIKNLMIQDADVIGGGTVGILCGDTQGGSFTNCYVSGKVRGNVYVGGLAGTSNNITDCASDVDVKGSKEVGGLVGRSTGTISYCESKGTVFGYDNVGGICGNLDKLLIDSTNYATVNGYRSVGGIAGWIRSEGSITSCFNEGAIKGIENVGGIAGVFNVQGTITDSTNHGDVTGRHCVGGIIGMSSLGIVTDCSNTGNVIVLQN